MARHGVHPLFFRVAALAALEMLISTILSKNDKKSQIYLLVLIPKHISKFFICLLVKNYILKHIEKFKNFTFDFCITF